MVQTKASASTELSVDDRLKVERSLIEAKHDTLKRELDLSATMLELSHDLQKATAKALGAARYRAYLDLRAQIRAENKTQGVRLTPAVITDTTSQEVKEQRRIDLKRFDIDSNKLRPIIARYTRDASNEIKRVRIPDAMLPLGGVAQPFPEPGDPGWEWHYPPIDWTTAYMTTHTSRGYALAEASTLRYNCQINLRNEVELNGADDSDFDTAFGQGVFSIWFTLPTTGLVELAVSLRAIEARGMMNLANEVGESSSVRSQTNHCTVQEIWPRKAEESRVIVAQQWSEGDGGDFHIGYRLGKHEYTIAEGGELRQVRAYSKDPYPAGHTVGLLLGLTNIDDQWLNDMSSTMRSWHQWMIEAVGVRSTGPAPA